MNKNLELLAPAGDINSLYAAVQSGADAIYVGGKSFSARASAANFDEETLIHAIDYCHKYGVKLYVTLNIMIKERELPEAIEYVRFLYNAGADAVIVQDLGFAQLIHNNFPDFELHASTQMTTHNGDGAEFLTNKGFHRIVLSRELSFKEVEHISTDLGIETEMFVHGALCISYSGQCLMSSMIGGRSGNRGRCAQPCRLPYTIINENTKAEKGGYLLSPKDICALEDISEVLNTGVTSLKIEGRMKKPEYVAAAVSSYREEIDRAAEISTDEGHVEENLIKLKKLFNREGFSKAYFHKNTGGNMMAYNFPRNMGTVVGKVNNDKLIVLSDSISLRDGLRIGISEKGFIVEKIFLNGVEVKAAKAGDMVKVKPDYYNRGDIIYKTLDYMLNEELSSVYKNNFKKKLPLPLELYFSEGVALGIKTNYGGISFEVSGDLVQKAVSRPLSLERIVENLSKSGESPFYFKNITAKVFEDGFLSLASVNAARRELISKIEDYLIAAAKHNICEKIVMTKRDKNKLSSENNFFAVVNRTPQLSAALESTGINICANIFNRGENAIREGDIKGKSVYLFVPAIVKEEFESMCNKINFMLESDEYKILGIITANIGIINRFASKTILIGDYKLNNYNSYTGEFFSGVLHEMSVSTELNRGEISEMSKGNSIPLQAFVYGKTELMISEYCPIGSVLGGKTDVKGCGLECEKGTFTLKDRKDEKFLITTDLYCRSHIYNTTPINLINESMDLKTLGINSFRADFIDEDYDTTLKVIASLVKQNWTGETTNYTRGHYKRGVE